MQIDCTNEIRSFIVETFLLGQGNQLHDETSFLGEGIIDSTGILELVSFIEEHYGIQVEDRELVPENLDSIENVAAYVRTKLNGATVPISDGQNVCEEAARTNA